MGKYTASPHAVDLARAALRAAAALALAAAAGCASTSSSSSVTAPPPAPAAAPAEQPAAPATIEPIADSSQAAETASGLSLRQDAPLRYVVKKGDTLWGVAAYYLHDPWQWPHLWYANPQIKNPHLIYPGERLTLVRVDGRTRLALDNTERLSPHVREEPLAQAIPAIPIDAIREFLHGPRVVTRDEINAAPYVVAFTSEHVVAGQANGIFVKNLPDGGAPNWSVVRIGETYTDPDTGEALGFEAIPDGEAELRQKGQPATMMLTASTEEVLIGDRLLPIENEDFKAAFYPHPPAGNIDGRIISVYGGVGQIAQYQIVAINRGRREGLDPGTVLSIFKVRAPVADPYGNSRVALPDQPAGVVLVFKVSERVSYALVMSNTLPAHVLDKVKNPAAAGSY
ncbi:MAG: LysM peptidoglycan-binding domain-containing protein [Nevskia sp.]|nr:LysM peptidoglycan-binding domain-containing protein [Nevskia sp.]